ncbi:MAG: LLM class flavin-dependent oxidoreductase [Acidimicrobiia bacterium]|nr:LLM class flavin-dependent oxidoreductase [Acidimicrobiia bacterium]
MRLGIALADRDLPDDAGIAAVRLAEDGGADSVWTNETGGADACVTLGAWAAVTDHVGLGTGVVPLSARSTATLALAAGQVDRLAAGRVALGIGVGQRAAAEKVHEREWRAPLAWTADALQTLTGNGYPVVVGALGPQMTALAARSADGVLCNWNTPEHAREVRDRVHALAVEAGRDSAGIAVHGYVRVAAGTQAEAALAEQIGFYSRLPFYREHWAAMGDPEPSQVSLSTRDGHGLREGLAAYDAYDVVIARLVPTADFGLLRLVEAICQGS